MPDIEGVIVSGLATQSGKRGYVRELMRAGDSPLDTVAQITATMSYPGVIEAFHWHEQQDDLWYCAKGMIQAVLYDRRDDSATKGVTQVVCLGDQNSATLFVPRGVVHGYKVIGTGQALVMYATNQIFNPEDEFRINYDDPEISYDWTVKAR